MPIESSKNVPGLRPVGPIDARMIGTASGTGAAPSGAAAPASTGAVGAYRPSDALDPGAAPVDMERVNVIRRAIESGTYPVIPTKIADAMIAAGLLLRASA